MVTRRTIGLNGGRYTFRKEIGGELLDVRFLVKEKVTLGLFELERSSAESNPPGPPEDKAQAVIFQSRVGYVTYHALNITNSSYNILTIRSKNVHARR